MNQKNKIREKRVLKTRFFYLDKKSKHVIITYNLKITPDGDKEEAMANLQQSFRRFVRSVRRGVPIKIVDWERFAGTLFSLLLSSDREPILTFPTTRSKRLVGVRVTSIEPRHNHPQKLLAIGGTIECFNGRKVRDIDPSQDPIEVLVEIRGRSRGTIRLRPKR